MQMALSWKALHWRGTRFDERFDSWLNRLGQAAEWFPLLGLLGTVAAILQTFSSPEIAAGARPEKIIFLYAPAITATGSGLFMALFNIVPLWVVMMGRDLILAAGGGERPLPEEAAR
jgi:biopolymer transport protein ExbB/TolQ